MFTSGRIHFQVPEACQGPNTRGTCAASMTRMALSSIGTLRIGDQTVSNVRLINGQPSSNEFVTDYSEGSFSIPAGTQFGLTGDVSGKAYQYASLKLSAPVDTRWDWASRFVSLGTRLVSEDGTLAIELQGVGIFDSLPPTSVAAASPEVLACGRSTRLSAVNSIDPDGPRDIRSVTWTTDPTGRDQFIWQASGMTVDVYPPTGTHRYYATVVDSVGSTHTSFVDVKVTCE